MDRVLPSEGTGHSDFEAIFEYCPDLSFTPQSARSSMDRVLPSEGRGCWFDPSRARQIPQLNQIVTLNGVAGAVACVKSM